MSNLFAAKQIRTFHQYTQLVTELPQVTLGEHALEHKLGAVLITPEQEQLSAPLATLTQTLTRQMDTFPNRVVCVVLETIPEHGPNIYLFVDVQRATLAYQNRAYVEGVLQLGMLAKCITNWGAEMGLQLTPIDVQLQAKAHALGINLQQQLLIKGYHIGCEHGIC